MGIERSWNVQIGRLEPGPRNLITDVDGVQVGHCTLDSGPVQTGVTALLPHRGNVFQHKVMAASHVINGFGKSVGLTQIDELGTVETPILLTNTLSVGTVSTALIKDMLEQNPDIGNTTSTVNPVVCECNDGFISDIRGLHVEERHVSEALAACAVDFAEGAVGAGRGMRCHGLKGGIGSASRRLTVGDQTYTLGTLVLSNHGTLSDLVVAGDPIGQRSSNGDEESRDKGSVIVVMATDAPLSERQLKRVSKRAVVGLSRTGSHIGSGSGEIVLAFTTANRVSHYPGFGPQAFDALHDDHLDIFFRGIAEASEESVVSSMLHAVPLIARDGEHVQSLGEVLSAGSGREADGCDLGRGD